MTEYKQKIKEWPEDDRPREKLLKKGSTVLSDSELLGILIAKGTREKSAVDIGRELLKKYNSLYNLSSRLSSEFSSIKGIGPSKAATITAAFEIARRVQKKQDSPTITFKSPKDVADHYIPLMRDMKKEVFKAALMNGANRLIKDITISEGILNASLVHPREVFREAVLEPTSGIILIHNHPSGDVKPSEEDIKITRQLVEAGKIFGIKILDHVIIARDNHISLADTGII
ncbi:MAG: DNA repair protein RadC [Nitrospirae bacterium]|nr:DNA repair protein RadC [Nitrospirota bacterium]